MIHQVIISSPCFDFDYVAVRRVSYQSILMGSWLEGKSAVGKRAQAKGMTTLRKQSTKVDSRTWESFTGVKWGKLESVQEPQRTDVSRKSTTTVTVLA